METRQIGKSGIETSALALGCWAIGGGSWWGDNDDQMSVDTIHRAFDLGIRWIDTARVYGFGHSEEVVGKALKELPRDQVIISTKCALQWYEKKGEYHFTRDGHEVDRDLSPKAIRRDLEKSLQALGTDYIDVYYTHWQCKTYGLVPVAETMEEADAFLEDCMAVVCKNKNEVKKYFEESGADIAGMSQDEILSAQEVFAIGDGRYLIVEA